MTEIAVSDTAVVETNAAEKVDRPRFMLGRRPALDGLRGLAISLVLFHHAQRTLAPGLIGSQWQGGFLGVELFFVLSGFLITSLLLDQWQQVGTISLKRFYARRALRLFPALYVVMIAQFIYARASHEMPGRIEVEGLALIAAYVGNWSLSLGGPSPADLGQTWSLAVEEQFYLIWPLLLILGLRFSRNRILLISIGVIALACAAIRAILWARTHSYITVFPQTESYVDALMIGAATALVLHIGWRPGSRWIYPIAAVGAAVIVGAFFAASPLSDWIYLWGFTAVSLATALVILAVLEPKGPFYRVLAWEPLRWLGFISYSLYLWHVLVFLAISRAAPHAPYALTLTIGLGLAFALAIASYRLVETPFLALRPTFSRLALRSVFATR